MTQILFFLNVILLTGISLFFLVLSLSSLTEKEYRAAAVSFGFLLFNALFWTVLLFFSDSLFILNLLVIMGLGLFSLVSFLRFFPEDSPERDTDHATQYDERDNMFSRNHIARHPDLMKQYYEMRPENESVDRQIHQKPEFGQKEQVYHDPHTVPFYGAAFQYLEGTIPLSDGEPAEKKARLNPERFCSDIRDFAIFYGACDVGFTPLKPHHFYSHRGRHAPSWGKKTDQTHKTAITIVVPMRVEMLRNSPTSCVIQESAQKYVEAAKISNILAGTIRQLGYRARAHNDANYETLCVPLAVESGLGELGRMGIFMHRVHGPCIRLAVVTTELELPPSPDPPLLHMENFCRICKKCADNCPSGSISSGEEPTSRNFRHWSIQQEKCFSYWKTIGSDCGLCISVCPYTKPDTPIHRFVRYYISRNILNQKIALFMDDVLYGRYKKIPKTNPDRIFWS